MATKGIILAGGRGTRLYPATAVVSKQLLPVYDKPMIYYPLANLMSAGVREICVITNPDELKDFTKLLKDGSQWGISITFLTQKSPDGIPQAFTIAREFIGNNKSILMLGDNVLVGSGLGRRLRLSAEREGCSIFGYEVEDPTKYGNIRFRKNGAIRDIVEKPKKPHSRFVVPGIYFCDESAPQRVQKLKKSERGEYEIADLLNSYANVKLLNVGQLSRGTVWIDTGNSRDLSAASEYIRVLQQRQGTYIACLEEIALRAGWIDEKTTKKFALNTNSEYAKYVRNLSKESISQEIEQ